MKVNAKIRIFHYQEVLAQKNKDIERLETIIELMTGQKRIAS